MSSLATAVVGTAVIGGLASKNAADKASDATKAGLKQSGALAEQSRNNAMSLYNQGRQSAQRGLMGAFDFYKKAAPSRYQPMQLGNVAAQRAIGQGSVQANNAILGNPVDMSFAQPQQINPDMSFIQNAQLPVMDPNIQAEGLIPQPVQNAATAAATQTMRKGLMGRVGR